MRQDETKQVEQVTSLAFTCMAALYQVGYGMRTTLKGLFKYEIWARDFVLACFCSMDTKMEHTLLYLLNHARTSDGALPLRIETIRHSWGIVFGCVIGTPFDFVTRRSAPVAIYDDSFGTPSPRDTVFGLVIAFGELLQKKDSLARSQLLLDYFPILERAFIRELNYVGSNNLIKGKGAQDWFDCAHLPGERCLVNILFKHACSVMAHCASELGRKNEQVYYRKLARITGKAINRHFWNPAGYYQAGIDDTRLDVAANTFAILYGIGLKKAIAINKSIISRVGAPHGLLWAFDHRYPSSVFHLHFRLVGFTNYGHGYLYPWIAQLNMIARLKIADQLDSEQAEVIIQSVLRDFLEITHIHFKNATFQEVLDPQTFKGATHRIFFAWTIFRSSQGFLASCATYLKVFEELKKHGVFKDSPVEEGILTTQAPL